MRLATLCCVGLFGLATVASLAADDVPLESKVGHAMRVDQAPRVDGDLDEPAWTREARWFGGLTQKDPVEGLPAGEFTEVAFVYDDDALYFAARLWTPETGRISARLSPRDDMGQTQAFFVSLDTYHDRRTAYTFGVTAAGVRVDFYHPQDVELNQVLSWDPVWEAKARILDDRWVVEARIPFSQLRFSPADEQVWGLQLDRWTPERDAEDYWCMVPRAETGWASRFGELRGIRGAKPSARVELLPYVAGEAGLLRHREGEDPFRDLYAADIEGRAGGDLKMGLGPNLTLDLTINPDFGQVEGDPAEVNLSAFETFFSERRPFFLEGDRLLRGNGPTYYYSRRIGSAPHGRATDPDVTHVDMPSATRILGAAKLTGRLDSGTSVGALAAVTDEEHARTWSETTGEDGGQRVEPRAGFGVLRVQQEFGDDGSTVGATLTGVGRQLEDDAQLSALLAERAVSGGLDWTLRVDNGFHELRGYWGFSRVEGDTLAIGRIQRSPAHYYQRPDVDHLHYDGSRDALAGWTANLELERAGGEHLRWEVGASAESPGFELNDLGSLGSADDLDGWASMNWIEDRGRGLFRRTNTWLFSGGGWNFGGLPTSRRLESGFWGQFRNFWSVEGGLERGFSAWSDHLSRGALTLGQAGENFARVQLASPEILRANSVSAGVNVSWGGRGRESVSPWFFTRLRPGPRWEIRFNPSCTRDLNPMQYLTTLRAGTVGLAADRPLFATLDYREARLATRVRYTFNPTLRLEWYGEPFVADLRFRAPGRPAGARSENLERYADPGGADGVWTLQEEGGPVEIARPDARFSSWRSNLVLRWDWRLGSTLWLVWQQDRARFLPTLEHDRIPDPLDALSTGGDQLFALKFSYWIAAG